MNEENQNFEFQNEELNALSAIYGQDFVVDEESDSNSKICSINLRSSTNEDNWALFKIRLPSDYPSNSPPIFELNCPFMSSADKNELSLTLQSIYLNNINQQILYLWIEEVKSKLSELGNNLEEEKTEISPSNELDYYCGATNNFSTTTTGNELELPKIISGPTITDRKSTFQAHLASPLVCKEQVREVLKKLNENSKIARATHNMYAYRICDGGRTVVQDCEDDGEQQAGGRLSHLLSMMEANNVLVVVSRWYGGIHLGPDRFKHINNVARVLLEQEGFGPKPKQPQGDSKNKRHQKK